MVAVFIMNPNISREIQNCTCTFFFGGLEESGTER